MLQWFLHMEEHCFCLFLIKVMASRSILTRSSLSLPDREKSLAMCAVCTDDLKEELQHYSSFRHDDSQLPYVCSVLEHCKAVISLRLPLEKDFTFPLAPNWNTPPLDDKLAEVILQAVELMRVSPSLPMRCRLTCLHLLHSGALFASFLTLGPCIDVSYLCSSLS